MTKEMLDKLCGDIKASGTDIILQLPCDRIAPLLGELSRMLPYISLTREEEGVGIAAGIALAGAKPLMIVQSSGMGNMVNAILSLTNVHSSACHGSRSAVKTPSARSTAAPVATGGFVSV